MFEEFDRDENLVIACEGRKIAYINDSASAYFGCYGFAAVRSDITSVMTENSYKIISEGSGGGDEFSACLTLSDGHIAGFTIKKITHNERKYILMRSEKKETVNEYELLSPIFPHKIYDPQMLGVSGIYAYETKKCLETIYSDIEYLKRSASIRRNGELYAKLIEIEQSVEEVVSKSKEYINNISSDAGSYIVTRKRFLMFDLTEHIIGKIKDFIKIENHNIDFVIKRNCTDEFVCADHLRIAKALTILIGNSIRYILASGRKGKITVTCKKNSKNEVIVTIKDNGIGVSEKTFGVLNDSAGLYSVLPDVGEDSFAIDISAVASWLEMNGGKLIVKNSPGSGSLSEIRLPISKEGLSINESATTPDVSAVVFGVINAILKR